MASAGTQKDTREVEVVSEDSARMKHCGAIYVVVWCELHNNIEYERHNEKSIAGHRNRNRRCSRLNGLHGHIAHGSRW